MASTKPLEPVLHCSAVNFRKVSLLANKIINTGVYNNPLVFVTPPLTKVLFTTPVTLLDLLITQSRDSKSKKSERKAQSIIVFNNIVEILEYVKPICNHDPVLINQTGFDTNVQAQKSPVPDQPMIEKIVKGKVDSTYKVFLQRSINKTEVAQAPSTHLRNVTFAVEITLTPDVDASWVMVLSGVKSNSIIIDTYTPLVKNYVRVHGRNPSGKGQVSMIYSFIPD